MRKKMNGRHFLTIILMFNNLTKCTRKTKLFVVNSLRFLFTKNKRYIQEVYPLILYLGFGRIFDILGSAIDILKHVTELVDEKYVE